MGKRYDSLKINEKEIYMLFYKALKSKKTEITIANIKIVGVSLIHILIDVLRDFPEIDYVKYDLEVNKGLINTKVVFCYKTGTTNTEKIIPTVIKKTAPTPAPNHNNYRLTSADRFYYFSTLNDEEKIAYQTLLTAFRNFDKICYVKRSGFSFDRLFNIFIGVLEDNPSVFYVDNKLNCNYNNQYFIVKIAYSIKKSEAEEYAERITQFLKKYFSKYITGYSEYQKALIIHDSIVKNMQYKDDKKSIRHNIIGPIFEKTGVCEGFSELAKLIGDYIGVNVQCIYSDDDGSEAGHMWNLVKINGDWYHMDITYDLCKNDVIKIAHQYFLITDEFCSKDHTWDRNIYPVCSSTEYNYYEKEGLIFTDKHSLKTYISQSIKNKKYETEFRYLGKKITMDEISAMALSTNFSLLKPLDSIAYSYYIGDFSIYLIKWIIK